LSSVGRPSEHEVSCQMALPAWCSFAALVFTLLLSRAVSWSPNNSPVSGLGFSSAVWMSSESCVMIGNSESGSVIAVSHDAGRTHQLIHSLASPSLDIATTSCKLKRFIIVITKDSEIVVLSSSHESPFTSYHVPPIPSIILRKVTFGYHNAFAVGHSLSDGMIGTVYKSTVVSKFRVWIDRSPPQEVRTTFTAVSSFDGVSVIVVGSNGAVFYSTDAGSNYNTHAIIEISHVHVSYA
jgi:hypothetical protein